MLADDNPFNILVLEGYASKIKEVLYNKIILNRFL